MKATDDNNVLMDRVLHLEEVVRAQNGLLTELVERIGNTFARQAFTIQDLMVRWACSESYARKIVSSHRLKLLRGPNGQARSPITVLRGSVLDYENGHTLVKFPKRKTKPVPTWEEQPYLPKPELIFPKTEFRVRKLGRRKCELPQEKSHAHKSA